jgi:hypothetical protein
VRPQESGGAKSGRVHVRLFFEQLEHPAPVAAGGFGHSRSDLRFAQRVAKLQ